MCIRDSFDICPLRHHDEMVTASVRTFSFITDGEMVNLRTMALLVTLALTFDWDLWFCLNQNKQELLLLVNDSSAAFNQLILFIIGIIIVVPLQAGDWKIQINEQQKSIQVIFGLRRATVHLGVLYV